MKNSWKRWQREHYWSRFVGLSTAIKRWDKWLLTLLCWTAMCKATFELSVFWHVFHPFFFTMFSSLFSHPFLCRATLLFWCCGPLLRCRCMRTWPALNGVFICDCYPGILCSIESCYAIYFPRWRSSQCAPLVCYRYCSWMCLISFFIIEWLRSHFYSLGVLVTSTECVVK